MPWRIHGIASDFRLEDVWALPTPGGPDDFPRLVTLMESYDPSRSSTVVGILFAIRSWLGERLGLDHSDSGLGARVPTLRDRLPDDLRVGATISVPDDLPFRPIYLTDDEAALEIANETMHGVLHLGWVPDGSGGYRGQMAVLVKPNGRRGQAYMAAIAPFRHLVVYPAMMSAINRIWRGRPREQSVVTQIDVPPDIRKLSNLPGIDYSDAFLVRVSSPPHWTAEQWARVVLEDAPAQMRAQLQAGWTALGLRGAASAASILGWDVRRGGAEFVLLGRDSRVGMPGELLFALRPEGLIFATFIHHQNAATRAVWATVERKHVDIVQVLLNRAAASASAAVRGQGVGGAGSAGAGGGNSGSAGGGNSGSAGEVGTFGPGA